MPFLADCIAVGRSNFGASNISLPPYQQWGTRHRLRDTTGSWTEISLAMLGWWLWVVGRGRWGFILGSHQCLGCGMWPHRARTRFKPASVVAVAVSLGGGVMVAWWLFEEKGIRGGHWFGSKASGAIWSQGPTPSFF